VDEEEAVSRLQGNTLDAEDRADNREGFRTPIQTRILRKTQMLYEVAIIEKPTPQGRKSGKSN
jgi:hypothetical protein